VKSDGKRGSKARNLQGFSPEWSQIDAVAARWEGTRAFTRAEEERIGNERVD